ncbi:MAG: cyclase family protein [Candidatus Geothermincolia bacterium]
MDITAPLTERLPVWPGDPPFTLHHVATIEESGAAVSAITMSNHAGTHLDAPRHYLPDGPGVEEAPLEMLVGVARVLEIPGRAEITPEDLLGARIKRGQRILLKTDNSLTPWWERSWQPDFCSLTPEAADWLARRGVALVGIDCLSVAPVPDAASVHAALLGAGVWILEGLRLQDVAAGRYECICLPLAVEADGAPARVLLRPTGRPFGPRRSSCRR